MAEKYSCTIILVLILFTLINCTNSNSSEFRKIECNAQYSPKYDPVSIGETENSDGTYSLEPRGKLIKELRIFKPCKEYYYSGKYISVDGSFISESSIRLVATGRRWKQDSLSQDEVIIQYKNNASDLSKFNNLQKYNSYKINEFIEEDTIGIVENNEEIWFHQLFRVNQFKITELAGPINIDYPIELNDITRSSSLIKLGRQIEIDTTSNKFNNYIQCKNTAKHNSSVESNIGVLRNCWTFISESESRLGIVSLKFLFQEKIGFVKFEYSFNEGDKIIIELVESK